MSTLEKARIHNESEKMEDFFVQFNPNSLEYSLGKDIYDTKKAKDKSTQDDRSQSDVTKSANSGHLSVKLFFYTYTNETTYSDVNDYIGQLRKFYKYTESSMEGKQPVITFAWGTTSVKGIMTSLSISYQMFAPDGTPVQAEVSITIEGSHTKINIVASDHASQFKSTRELAGGENGKLPDNLSWLFL